ncbi:MAG: hypothetical protein AAFP84_01095 [Actinomycetota bacterium]
MADAAEHTPPTGGAPDAESTTITDVAFPGGGDARPTLVFDDSCPMCKVYTGAFDALGWSGRTPFSTALDTYGDVLDLDRARHEIPIIDPTSRTVRYGLDGLGALLADRVPLLAWWFRHPLVLRWGRPVYDFISYNRREIAGSPPPATGFDCAPDHHPGWMTRYQVGVGLATVAIAATKPAAIGATVAATLIGGAMLGVADEDAGADGRRTRRSHVVTCAFVGAAAARTSGAVTRRPVVGLVVGVAAGLHQVARRGHVRR